MKYWLDTEFIEYPCTIDLISIGMVCEDGRELYLISDEFDESKADPWVVENVISLLGDGPRHPRHTIRHRVLEFVKHKSPEFWGYYADYDWVALCWLMGTMMDLPKGWPMFCRDLKQWAVELGNPDMPPQLGGEHNALEDAKWNREAHSYLKRIEKCVPPPRRADAEQLLEQVIESTTDEAGDWAENYFDPLPTKEEMAELEESLQKVWDAWEKKHKFEPTWFNIHNTKEHPRE